MFILLWVALNCKHILLQPVCCPRSYDRESLLISGSKWSALWTGLVPVPTEAVIQCSNIWCRSHPVPRARDGETPSNKGKVEDDWFHNENSGNGHSGLVFQWMSTVWQNAQGTKESWKIILKINGRKRDWKTRVKYDYKDLIEKNTKWGLRRPEFHFQMDLSSVICVILPSYFPVSENGSSMLNEKLHWIISMLPANRQQAFPSSICNSFLSISYGRICHHMKEIREK